MANWYKNVSFFSLASFMDICERDLDFESFSHAQTTVLIASKMRCKTNNKPPAWKIGANRLEPKFGEQREKNV